MKLIGKLKTQVEKAETREAAREPIADAEMPLNDDELDQVSGGSSVDDLIKNVTMVCDNDNCKKEFLISARSYAVLWQRGIACPYCWGNKTHKKEE